MNESTRNPTTMLLNIFEKNGNEKNGCKKSGCKRLLNICYILHINADRSFRRCQVVAATNLSACLHLTALNQNRCNFRLTLSAVCKTLTAVYAT